MPIRNIFLRKLNVEICRLKGEIKISNAVNYNRTAQNVGVGTADTVEQIVVEGYHEYVGMRFAYNALVLFYLVASAVYF